MLSTSCYFKKFSSDLNCSIIPFSISHPLNDVKANLSFAGMHFHNLEKKKKAIKWTLGESIPETDRWTQIPLIYVESPKRVRRWVVTLLEISFRKRKYTNELRLFFRGLAIKSNNARHPWSTKWKDVNI